MQIPIFPEATQPSTSALEYRWALRFSPFLSDHDFQSLILYFG